MTETPETDYYDRELSHSPIARELKIQRDTAIAERDEAREQLSEWRILNLWGGTPEIIHEFIKGQQDRIHHAQNVEKELAVAIAERDVLLQAIRNLRDTKGRYHTQQAFEYLMTLLPTNQND